MTKKLKWRVAPAPVGPYRSFEHRAWPTAEYSPGEKIAALVNCDDEYVPKRVRAGDHGPLKLLVMDWSGNKPVWRRVKREFATLDEVKAYLPKLLEAKPELQPNE